MTYAAIKAMNWSTLKRMEVPLGYRWAADHPDDRDTPAMLLGRAIHCMVLEPEEFDGRYYSPQKRQCEEIIKGGKQCSRNAVPGDVFCKQHGGSEKMCAREILTPAQLETVVRCAGAVEAHPEAYRLLEGCQTEVTAQWKTDGVWCKARIDALHPRRVIDLKTTRDMQWFQRDCAQMLYHGQLAWYTNIIAVETAPPYDVGVFHVGDEALAAGRRLYTELLDTWRACTEMGKWPGRYPGIEDLRLPRWAAGVEESEEY
jgi:exodeoxyribonuclease VIII